MSEQENSSKKKRYTWVIALFWIFFTLGVGSFITVFTLISNGKLGYIPPYEEIENPKNKSASLVYSDDGEVLSTYFLSTENRVVVKYNELSPNLIKALIATEDARYTDHSGIDFRGLGRAFVKRLILQNKSAGGASTITQQLAKQLFSTPAGSTLERAFQKLNEYVISVKLEKYYTKEEILAMYLNKFDFLNNAVGIKTASQVYFSTTPDALKLEEAAVFVGMCKNPAIYNPVRFPDKVIARRNVVFGQMVKAGFLTVAEGDSLSKLPLELKYQKVDHKTGPCSIF